MAARHTLIDAAAMTADIEGNPIKVSNGEYLACYAAWTAGSAAPTGTLTWQFSHDLKPGREAQATWTDLELDGSPITFGSIAGAAGSVAEIFEAACGYLRLYYTAGSGGTGAALLVTAERGVRR